MKLDPRFEARSLSDKLPETQQNELRQSRKEPRNRGREGGEAYCDFIKKVAVQTSSIGPPPAARANWSLVEGER